MNFKRMANYLVSLVGILQEFLKNFDKKQTAVAIRQTTKMAAFLTRNSIGLLPSA